MTLPKTQMRIQFECSRRNGLPSVGDCVLISGHYGFHALTRVDSTSPSGKTAKCALGTLRFEVAGMRPGTGELITPLGGESGFDYGIFEDLPPELVREVALGKEREKELRRSKIMDITGCFRVDIDVRFFLKDESGCVFEALERTKEIVQKLDWAPLDEEERDHLALNLCSWNT